MQKTLVYPVLIRHIVLAHALFQLLLSNPQEWHHLIFIRFIHGVVGREHQDKSRDVVGHREVKTAVASFVSLLCGFAINGLGSLGNFDVVSLADILQTVFSFPSNELFAELEDIDALIEEALEIELEEPLPIEFTEPAVRVLKNLVTYLLESWDAIDQEVGALFQEEDDTLVYIKAWVTALYTQNAAEMNAEESSMAKSSSAVSKQERLNNRASAEQLLAEDELRAVVDTFALDSREIYDILEVEYILDSYARGEFDVDYLMESAEFQAAVVEPVNVIAAELIARIEDESSDAFPVVRAVMISPAGMQMMGTVSAKSGGVGGILGGLLQSCTSCFGCGGDVKIYRVSGSNEIEDAWLYRYHNVSDQREDTLKATANNNETIEWESGDATKVSRTPATGTETKIRAVSQGWTKITATAGDKSASVEVFSITRFQSTSTPVQVQPFDVIIPNSSTKVTKGPGGTNAYSTAAPSSSRFQNQKFRAQGEMGNYYWGRLYKTDGTLPEGTSIRHEHYYFVAKASVTVPVQSISVSPTTVSLSVNGTRQLTATITPSNATNKTVVWSSNPTGIVTVSSNGLVTAVKAGTTVVTVKTNDGGKTATCAVTVTASGGGGNAPSSPGGTVPNGFVWPLPGYYSLSSYYGFRNLLGNYFHYGLDVAYDLKTVVAMADGTIYKKETTNSAGNKVVIKHSNGYYTVYQHLNSFQTGLQQGAPISQGDPIGKSGKTGNVTGPHLHFEILRDDSKVSSINPINLFNSQDIRSTYSNYPYPVFIKSGSTYVFNTAFTWIDKNYTDNKWIGATTSDDGNSKWKKP